MMNKIQITICFTAFLILACMATNPSIEDHREAVFEKVQDNIKSQNISRDNYLLFSKTRIRFNDNFLRIGTGFFGRVWIDNELPKEFVDINSSELLKKDSTKFETEIIDLKREQVLKGFQGKYWKNEDFYTMYFNLTYIGKNKYKFKLYSKDICKISIISGVFKLELNNKGIFYSKSCGKITFDFNDLFNPEYKNQPIISIESEKEYCMNCYVCEGCMDIYTFGRFWKKP